ncbi:MAG: translation initiation factor IF-2 [Actinomycetales bacterium]|nr:MAG: translation initiation factor IF-2 [Actinomycetales bacterium]
MNENDKKKSNSKTLSLRGGGGSSVRMNLSHGRSKSVLIETKRKKIILPNKNSLSQTPKTNYSGTLDSNNKSNEKIFSDEQIDRRKKAIEAAREREIQVKKEQEKLQNEKNLENESKNNEIIKQSDEVVEDIREVKKVSVENAPKNKNKPDAKFEGKTEDNSPNKKFKKDEELKEVKPTKVYTERRRSGKLTINQALSDQGGRQRSIASLRRRQEKVKRRQISENVEREKITREVQVPDSITVQEIANRMAERSASVVKTLMTNGIMATQNQTIDADTAILIVEEFGHTPIRISASDVEDAILKYDDSDDAKSLKERAPIITVMGHVDHGKTSLLDAIRKTNTTNNEAGGITQHIGAYQVKSEGGSKLTFLDTPGHAAFTSMRSRGAQVTDIIILVVAADDGVMPQTIEAINHAKAAKVPIIVAINKCDKENSDPNRVRTELLKYEVIVESMSGEVLDVEVSASTGKGIDILIENIVLQSEILELKSNPNRSAEGTVIEAKLDVGRGPVATVLVQKGTLKKGDIIVAGDQWGKVRALIDSNNLKVELAGPSVPVEVLGLNGTPEAGDLLNVVSSETKAREIADYRKQVVKDKKDALGKGKTLDQMIAKAQADKDISELPLLVKADVQGSAEAIVQALEKISTEEVRVLILHSGVGAITESDVILAEASNASIIGFNVRANASARDCANQKEVELRYYSIIYDLVDDIKKAASGLLKPEIKETLLGYAQILEVFKVSNAGKVAGCLITEGIAQRSAKVRLLRDNVVIHEGNLKTLKRFKDEVENVQSGQECGMAFSEYEDIRAKDVIEIFKVENIARTIN